METDSAQPLETARERFDAGDYRAAESLLSDVLAHNPAVVEAHQLLARTYIKLSDSEKAREILSRRADLPGGPHLFGWGGIAEELGTMDEAAAIYKDHLIVSPHHVPTLYRLGLLAVDRGEREKARTYFAGALKVDAVFLPALVELAGLYEEDGLLGLAFDLYTKALTLDPENPDLRTACDLLRDRLSVAQHLPDVSIEPVEQAVRSLLHLFRGRDGVYARQWVDDDGRVGYAPVHEPLTERIMEQHVRGHLTVGVYPVRVDGTVLFGAIDVDINKLHLPRAASDPAYRAFLDGKVKEDVKRLKGMFDGLDLPVVIESSDYKGCHLWLFFVEPLAASVVRTFLTAFVKRVGAPSPELHWEIFPKQEKVEEGQLGNLIKLPLGVHRKTGNRALFVDADGNAYADQVGFLGKVARVDRALLDAATTRLVEGMSPPAPEEGEGIPPSGGGSQEGPESLPRRYPIVGKMLEGCEVATALVEKAYTIRHLTNDERLVLACVCTHLGEEGQGFLHTVIGRCLDYDRKVTQYQIDHTHPHPISCPKIRRYLPDVTSSVNCACEFDLPEGGYPSPVLHVDGSFTKGMGRGGQAQDEGRETVGDREGGRPRRADEGRGDATKGERRPGPTTDIRWVEKLVSRYIALRKEHRKIQEELEWMTSQLLKVMDERGGTITLENWVITRSPDTGGVHIALRI
jgi:tetratricopeptide (TPR) repeat protein